MRGTRAKRMRKMIYGDYSPLVREYKGPDARFIGGIFAMKVSGRFTRNCTCICSGLRRAYQNFKRGG